MSSSTRKRLPSLVGASMLAGAALIGRHVAKRRPAIRRVAADLRNPVLYLPFDVRGTGSLSVGRKLGRFLATKVAPGIEVSDCTVPGSAGAPSTRVVLYERPDRKRPSGALLWIHGGGMVMGSPDGSHDWCSALADQLGILVASVDYRLAPEHPFPAGLTDCHTALTWLHEQAADLGIDTDRISVGGASAGGGLAAAVCQLNRDLSGPPICFQLLNYPMLDDRSVFRTDHQGRGTFIWTPASNRFGWSAYLGHAPSPAEAPMHAAPSRTNDLSSLPPAWIGVGDLDLFYDEDVDYANRLNSAGVPCDLHLEPAMYHGADVLMSSNPRMRAYVQRMTDALSNAIG